MSLDSKLLDIQESVDTLLKDGMNTSDKYSYISSDAVLSAIRPKMTDLKLLLEMSIRGHGLTEGTTKSGTTRYMTEMDIDFTWRDTESGETRTIPFYAQGVDLAGEKGVGKALTYAEKYFLLKQFHVPTSKDDPDVDKRSKNGEKLQKGTQAERENLEFYKDEIMRMIGELSKGDEEQVKAALVLFTRSKDGRSAGVDDIEAVPERTLGAIYGKVKKNYDSFKNGGNA